jgi:hypothetical protein
MLINKLDIVVNTCHPSYTGIVNLRTSVQAVQAAPGKN